MWPLKLYTCPAFHIKLFFLFSLYKYIIYAYFLVWLADMCTLNFRIFVKMSNVQFALVSFFPNLQLNLCLNHDKHFLNADFSKTDPAIFVFEQVSLRKQELSWNACTAFAGNALTNQCDWGTSHEPFHFI